MSKINVSFKVRLLQVSNVFLLISFISLNNVRACFNNPMPGKATILYNYDSQETTQNWLDFGYNCGTGKK